MNQHNTDVLAETLTTELHRLHALQRNAARTRLAPDAAERREALLRLKRAVLAWEDRLVAAVSADYGHRPGMETRLYEILPTLTAIRHTRAHVRKWMR
ncbi:MAG: hypothetical protein ACU0CI_10155, partial [Shimia sp.]